MHKLLSLLKKLQHTSQIVKKNVFWETFLRIVLKKRFWKTFFYMKKKVFAKTFFKNRFGTGVEHLLSNPDVVRPTRDQPPAACMGVSAISVFTNHEDGLGGRNVVPLLCMGCCRKPKQRHQLFRGWSLSKTTTHRTPYCLPIVSITPFERSTESCSPCSNEQIFPMLLFCRDVESAGYLYVPDPFCLGIAPTGPR